MVGYTYLTRQVTSRMHVTAVAVDTVVVGAVAVDAVVIGKGSKVVVVGVVEKVVGETMARGIINF